MLRAFWRESERSPTMSSQNFRLRVKSRMGASLVYDCLLRFRDNASAARAMPPPRTDAALRPVPDEHVRGAHFLDTTTTCLDTTLSSTDILNDGSNFDIIDMSWLEDIEYPGFADIEAW